MGSTNFYTHHAVNKTQSDKDAFIDALDNARHYHGSGGYSGTLAEKNSFTLITKAKSKRNAERLAEALLDGLVDGIPVYRQEMTESVSDKWGPAGAIRYPIDNKTDGILFFGYASC